MRNSCKSTIRSATVSADKPGAAPLREVDKFRSLCLLVLTQDKDVWCACSSEREARSLRRKFYRLRESLDFVERENVSQILFSVVGHRVRCGIARKRAPRNTAWPEKITLEEPNGSQ